MSFREDGTDAISLVIELKRNKNNQIPQFLDDLNLIDNNIGKEETANFVNKHHLYNGVEDETNIL